MKISFYMKFLTDKQTDRQTNAAYITSLDEVNMKSESLAN